MKMNKTPEEIFKEYSKCEQYNVSLDLYETVKKNENFYIGRQWEGVNAPDLDKPVLNFLKRVTTYFISMIVSDDIGVSFRFFLERPDSDAVAKMLSNEVDRVIERTRAKALNREMLKNAVVDGDGCFYLYFDTSVQNGQPISGEIVIENIDNTKVLFGNPYVSDVQAQPYLLIVKRSLLDTIKEQARQNGVEDIDRITPDDNRDRFYGEEKDSQNDLVTSIVKLWKQDGVVHYTEVTRDVVIKEETVTGYKLYPVAYMSWDKVKNSYHGQSAITGLIPNQIFVNKLWAMAMEHQKRMAFPKLFFDRTKIRKWTNKVGEAIGVEGNPNDAIASNFRAADMSGQVLELVEKTVSYTRDFMGASDAALGNVKPDNTSAIIAVQKASAAPLELQRLAFYQFIEDYVRIIVDMMVANYGLRYVPMEQAADMGAAPGMEAEATDGPVLFDFASLNVDAMELNVDVGTSAYWSELTQLSTNDNLLLQGILDKGVIEDCITYIEGIPDKQLNNKNKILERLKQKKAAQEAQAMQTAQMQQMPQAMPMQGGGMDMGLNQMMGGNLV